MCIRSDLEGLRFDPELPNWVKKKKRTDPKLGWVAEAKELSTNDCFQQSAGGLTQKQNLCSPPV